MSEQKSEKQIKTMFLFLNNSKLKKDIDFEKVGVLIRKISSSEINSIFSAFKNYFSKSINKYYDFYLEIGNNTLHDEKFDTKDKNAEEIKLYIAELERKTETLKIINKYPQIFMARKNCEAKGREFSIKALRKFLTSYYVVEIDNSKIDEHFSYEHYDLFVRKLLFFTIYIKDTKMIDKNIDQIKLKTAEELKDKYIGLLNCFANSDEMANSVDFVRLKKVADLLNREDSTPDFNFSFFDTIQSLVLLRTPKNEIVEIVSTIEKLLLSSADNNNRALKENFALKVGVLCYDRFGENQNLKELLRQLYEVRNMIVHGSIEKLVTNASSFKEILDNKFYLHDTNSRAGKAADVVNNAEIYLNLFAKHIISRYIDDPDFCKFLKE